MKAQLNMPSNEANSEKPKKYLTELKTYSIIALVVVMGVIFFNGMKADQTIIKYDCRQLIGGWHPDVPQQVMEECRKLNSGRI
jgi:hypothetical protein